MIKTDINDISSVGQNPKRVTPAQDTKFKCVIDETGMEIQIAWRGQMHHLTELT